MTTSDDEREAQQAAQAAHNAQAAQQAAAQLPPVMLPPQAVYIINKTLRTEPFVPSEDEIRNGKLWEEWLQSIEREFRYFQITAPQDQKDAMMIYGGKEISRLETSLPDPTAVPDYADDGETLNIYTRLKWKLTKYYKKRKNTHHATYLFNKLRPTSTSGKPESIVAYAARVREQAADCEFGDTRDRRVLDHLIHTVTRKDLVKRAISKRWDLNTFIREANETEDLEMQMKDMKVEESSVAKIGKKHDATRRKKYPKNKTEKAGSTKACGFCGLTGVHDPGKNCPAYGQSCRKCGGRNHFEKACRKDTSKWKKNDSKKRHVRKTEESEDSSDSEFFEKTAKHLKFAKHLHVDKVKNDDQKEKLAKIRINDVDVWIEPDTGADVNVMDEHQLIALCHRSETKTPLRPSKVKLNTLQGRLTVKGEIDVTIRNETCGVNTTFVIVKGRIDSPPLLSKRSLESLGMVKLDPKGGFAEENHLKIRRLMEDDKYHALKDKYREVFTGVGEIKDMFARFNMKEGVAPVAQKPRNIAYHLQEPLKKQLDQGEADGIYEKVPQGEPITWCSPLVVQAKPRFTKVEKEKLEPNMIRASIDLRVPNKYMERNRIAQSPIVEDFTQKFHDCKIFSKLDMNQGYHQLLLDPKSRAIATFSTPWGNYRPKRLVFGAKASQDSFDDAMQRIFGDIPRCLNQRDDILIGGRNSEEHDKTLEEVLQRAKEYNITFNEEKCVMNTETLEFYGYRFTKDGLKPTEEKVQAVKDSAKPESKTAVRSFLGMIGYLSKFIPNFSSLTAPLRTLTHKDVKFKWGAAEQTAFEQLKESITSEKTMMYFNPTLPIIVRTEASFNEGLAAALFHKTNEGVQPVHYISRSLSEAEKKYSQTEKDALAVAWAKTRFSMYLEGAPRFKIMTSHKPLIPMFMKATAKLPPRIEKWVMNMQDIDFEMVYEPGKDEADPLDFLSRHPLPETGDGTVEAEIKAAIQTDHAVVLTSIQKETEKDPEMRKLKETIFKGNWQQNKRDPFIASYFSIREQIYVAEGLIFRLDKIIVPQKLRRKTIKAAHSMGHLGMTKMKQMLRNRYWFPEMNIMIEEEIRKCFECQVTTESHQKEPVKMTEIPDAAWEVVSVDFGGPYPDGHYNLVVVDKRTRFPEVEQTHSTAAKPTIKLLRKIMTNYGIPRRLESDGGPPFTSKEFADFADEMGFHHHIVTPQHARANGEAESFMKMLNKTEQIAKLKGMESKEAVLNMLMGYRSTPHPATNITPYQALMNREVRTKIDGMENTNQDLQYYMNENDGKYKDKLKRQADDNRYVKKHQFIIGDYVLVRQEKKNKWSTAYEPSFYIVIAVNGSQIQARRVMDGREITRDASKFKLANILAINPDREDTREEEYKPEEIVTEDRIHVPVIENDPVLAMEPTAQDEPAIAIQEPADACRPEPETPDVRTPAKQKPNREQERPSPPSEARPARERKMPQKFNDYVMTTKKFKK